MQFVSFFSFNLAAQQFSLCRFKFRLNVNVVWQSSQRNNLSVIICSLLRLNDDCWIGTMDECLRIFFFSFLWLIFHDFDLQASIRCLNKSDCVVNVDEQSGHCFFSVWQSVLVSIHHRNPYRLYSMDRLMDLQRWSFKGDNLNFFCSSHLLLKWSFDIFLN